MPRKSLNEQLSEIEEKEKKLKEKKKQLLQRQAKIDRKKRTHNLIQLGAGALSVLGRDFKEGDVERLIAFLRAQNERGGYYTTAMNAEPSEASQTPSETSPASAYSFLNEFEDFEDYGALNPSKDVLDDLR